ncbi:putative flavoprotein [Desulfitobacterium dichloroeliminans LMG P-21439]|uniref:Putative flavoprotein n=1 Tax=Desulfitobacterium dichloroeliminans (strain LMG P-21439 / DCA1) TaxID=871963 RepID=L0F742_DESDL|nr:anaerobic nitric oxide reductase flavorubredoxin [Desulfitobacterium dichloroeliminans]AGA68471.1 putative flavoprotein [Desulfitobacterium dichloroeliminans LMG P-21439]
MSFKITETITYVGKIDWELRNFHGEEYKTKRGSSYNSYLIRDEKTVLIDTIWEPFGREFVTKLKQEIDLKEIDYIIMNHNEVDHSGALPFLMEEIPDTPIYCTANGKKILQGSYHKDWNFVEVKTGDRLNIGSRELIFIEARMLHWPDTMFSYLTGDNILFSNDGFGQHFASEHMYNDLVDTSELYTEALKYYGNILAPFSKMVTAKINEIVKLELPINMICPSHGVIWRDNPLQIVHKYLEWANDYQEDQVTIIYDTMWNATRKMAESIATGIRMVDPNLTVKLFNSARSDTTEIIGEVFRSKAIAVGSPTVNNGYLSSIAAIMEEIKGLKFKNKKAVAFGSYGWSGEVTKLLNEELKKGGFEVVDDGVRLMWTPDENDLVHCVELGKRIAQNLQ